MIPNLQCDWFTFILFLSEWKLLIDRRQGWVEGRDVQSATHGSAIGYRWNMLSTALHGTTAAV
jgi:hypothetical protein